jgi:hypothetical protein
MRPGSVERFDYVYTRNGVASLFLACEPLAGWRHLAVTDHRCRSDWALFIRGLLEERYRDAEKLVLVMDQLNTHSPASLYEAFPPEEAKRLADRLEIHHTPKHGSWLTMAEIELSVLARQCRSRRIARQDTLKRQIESWEERRNAARPQIKWQFTTLTTYRFRPEVVDGGRLGMVEARSWTERVLGWVGSSMRPGASAGCWASGCRGNARRNGRTSRFWLRPC